MSLKLIGSYFISEGSVFGDALKEIDASVGQILVSIKGHNIENNTLVILISDNGPALVSKTEGNYKFLLPFLVAYS